MRRSPYLLALLLAAVVSLTACGGNDSGQAGNTATKSIDITVQGDTVTPEGDRVQVSVGQPIQLVVTADQPGEIHVHSSPQQEFEYEKGTSTLSLQPIKAPGIVVVESHTLDKTIVQLEVR